MQAGGNTAAPNAATAAKAALEAGGVLKAGRPHAPGPTAPSPSIALGQPAARAPPAATAAPGACEHTHPQAIALGVPVQWAAPAAHCRPPWTACEAAVRPDTPGAPGAGSGGCGQAASACQGHVVSGACGWRAVAGAPGASVPAACASGSSGHATPDARTPSNSPASSGCTYCVSTPSYLLKDLPKRPMVIKMSGGPRKHLTG